MTAAFVATAPFLTTSGPRVPRLVTLMLRDGWVTSRPSKEEALRLLRAYWGSYAVD